MKTESIETGYTVGTPHPAVTDHTDATGNIRAFLAAAADYDRLALVMRRHAGRRLAELRVEMGANWYNCVDLDQRSAEMLVELGVNAKPQGHSR